MPVVLPERTTLVIQDRCTRSVAALLLATAVFCGIGRDTRAERPNIVLALADDWGWPHAGALGDKVIRTPTFDRLAEEGVLLTHAFAAAPTCTASRGAILTGQAVHRLKKGANLCSVLPAEFKVYPDLLEEAGYFVGYTRKGWAPGVWQGSGRARNPAGPEFGSFSEFLARLPGDRPFCFWFGSQDPHRPYEAGSGAAAGMKPEEVEVPPWLPDTPVVRNDILDYYFEVQRFDREVGEMLNLLRRAGKLDNTLVVMTGDHGFPFPRGKCTLYDSGTRVPLAIAWPGRVPGGRTIDDLVSLADLAPTFLEAAGIGRPSEMTARSLLGVLLSGRSGRVDPLRDRVFTERERHALSRTNDRSYPVRAIRTREYLYIRNFRPGLWPAGEEDWPCVAGRWGDVDASPSKTAVLDSRGDPHQRKYFDVAFGKRPAEELYDVRRDPAQLDKLADDPQYATVRRRLRSELERWMVETGDPRARGETDFWDTCPYVGGRPFPRNEHKRSSE